MQRTLTLVGHRSGLGTATGPEWTVNEKFSEKLHQVPFWLYLYADAVELLENDEQEVGCLCGALPEVLEFGVPAVRDQRSMMD